MRRVHGIYAMGFSKLQSLHALAVRRELPATEAALMRRMDALRPTIAVPIPHRHFDD